MTCLKDYLTNTKIRQQDFAATIGVEQASVSRLQSGQQIPTLQLAIKIEAVTNGEVDLYSWLPNSSSAYGPRICKTYQGNEVSDV